MGGVNTDEISVDESDILSSTSTSIYVDDRVNDTGLNIDGEDDEEENRLIEEQLTAIDKSSNKHERKINGKKSIDSDNNTQSTLQRSGSSLFILHKWLSTKDWQATRSYLEATEIDRKRLLSSVRSKNDDGETALHIACRKRAPYDIIKSLIDIGGYKLVMSADSFGGSLPLHHCCRFGSDVSIIRLLIYIGGRESVHTEDAIGNLPLQWALSKNAPFDVIKLLVGLGGHSTVTATNNIGWNALQAASNFNSNSKTIKLLCNFGGIEAIQYVNTNGDTALDILYEKNPFDKDSIQHIQDMICFGNKGVSWLSSKTIHSTMDWIFRQPEPVQQEAFSNPLMQYILNHRFIHFRILSVILIDVIAQCLLVTMMSAGYDSEILLGKADFQNGNLTILAFSTGWLGFRTLTHMLTIPVSSWAIDLANWLGKSDSLSLSSIFHFSNNLTVRCSEGLLQTIFTIWSVLILKYGMNHEHEAYIFVLTTGIVWFRLVFVIGDLNYSVSTFACALQSIVISLQGFFVTTVLVVLAFANMLNNSLIWDERNCTGLDVNNCKFSSRADSYYEVFRDVFSRGEILMDQEYMTEYRFTFVVVIFFLLLVELVLLNVLIAQIFSFFKEASERGKQAFWRHRFHVIKELDNVYHRIGLNISNAPGNQGIAEGFNDNPQVLPSGRFSFSTAHIDHFPGDFYGFRKWWMKNGKPPNPAVRIRYFLMWADSREILIPGASFERIISGQDRDSNSISSRMMLYLLFPLVLTAQLVIFVLGLITFSFLWPNYMKRFIFEGNIDSDKTSMKSQTALDSIHLELDCIHNEMKNEQYIIKNLEEDMRFIRRRLNTLTQNDTEGFFATEEDIYQPRSNGEI